MLIICFKKNQPQHCHHNDDSHHHHDGGGDGGRSSAHTLSGVFLLECHWPAVGMEPGQLFYSYSLYTHTNTKTTTLPPCYFLQEPLIFTTQSLIFHYFSTTPQPIFTAAPPLLFQYYSLKNHKNHYSTTTLCSIYNSTPQAYISPFRRIFSRRCWSE